MQFKSTAFECRTKAVAVKPDGIQVTLITETVDPSLASELTGLMNQDLEATLVVKRSQSELPFGVRQEARLA